MNNKPAGRRQNCVNPGKRSDRWQAKRFQEEFDHTQIASYRAFSLLSPLWNHRASQQNNIRNTNCIRISGIQQCKPDPVWLDGLMHKIETILPEYTHKLLESYFYRVFSARCNDTISNDYVIEATIQCLTTT
ncbi:hypothetical protein M5D96_010715 [Drosophila gunungcola]|uniref:Uncharacterized protein n=1 Tax=Drosophila gunungcola TaxID=103775 RepID=A0A9Q0BLW5_9MUSC|nr:hypothetical protein M5D96_010715 [Drosophila gunungcola]